MMIWCLQMYVYAFSAVAGVMVVRYLIGLKQTRDYVRRAAALCVSDPDRPVSFVILIPVLREQNVIGETISHFERLAGNCLDIHLCIAGTKREYATLKAHGFSKSTREVVGEIVERSAFRENFTVDFFEADDEGRGDRATQLNHALNAYVEARGVVDVVGVYDADSRPTKTTLLEVANRFLENVGASYQQPAFFLDAANVMRQHRENPLLIANAIYQNTWSVISEIPMWVRYGQCDGRSRGNFYCIGHGEFFPLSVCKRFPFPEHQVTDGIQIGYRLSMSGERVDILYSHCNDDVPHNLVALIEQHKRWFGGCMRLREAHRWCLANVGKSSFLVVADGLWSQFRWAFAANLYVLALVAAVFSAMLGGCHWLIALTLGLGSVYAYVLPICATCLTPIRCRVGLLPFLLLPVAIYVKSVGPSLYILNRLTGRCNVYGKVER